VCVVEDGVSMEEEVLFEYLSKSKVPSKVLAFS